MASCYLYVKKQNKTKKNKTKKPQQNKNDLNKQSASRSRDEVMDEL